MTTPEAKPAPINDLPMWVQVLGGLWCLMAVVLFIRQIMVAYLTLLTR